MTPEEFERLKEQEKQHLRQLRALKQQHRDAKRKKGLLDALQGLTRPDIDADHEEALGKLTMENIRSEARFEIALEESGQTEGALERAAREEAEREALRKSEAEALVNQMKASLGPSAATTDPTPTGTDAPAATGKTIGRVPPPEEAAPEADSDAPVEPLGPKSIGRPRAGSPPDHDAPSS